MSNLPLIAVLTGDLIGSRVAGADKVEAAMDQLSKTAAFFGPETRFTRFRGDGWQFILLNPSKTMRAILMALADLRANAIGIDTRISAGIGHYESLGTDNLSDASGSAFVVSGVGLDSLPKSRRLLVFSGQETYQDYISAITELVDWITHGWTQAQAEAVALALRFTRENHQQMATRIGITRQAMQARLSSAAMIPLDRAIQAFEGELWKLRK
jgi:hypothetical protein